jgi:hypothetical protein
MPENTSVTGRVTHTVADLTNRSDEEIKLLMGVAVAGLALAATLRAAQVLVDLGATFARRAAHSVK